MGRKPAVKAKTRPGNIDDYLAGVPEPARRTLSKMRATIRATVPPEAAEPSVTAFLRLNLGEGWFGSPLFPTTAACSLSPRLSKPLKNELNDFSTSKGTVHFPVDEPLPTALVKKLVKARVAESEKRKRH
jgi:uncharacterized protein YdhG (YjbR/CyaY superfamily)